MIDFLSSFVVNFVIGAYTFVSPHCLDFIMPKLFCLRGKKIHGVSGCALTCRRRLSEEGLLVSQSCVP